MVQKVPKVLKVHQVLLETKVSPVHQVIEVKLVLLVLKETAVIQVRKVPKEM